VITGQISPNEIIRLSPDALLAPMRQDKKA